MSNELLRAAELASKESGVALRLTGEGSLDGKLRTARFVLPNGLTIVLCPDFRAPVFAYFTWFKVGSKHEDPERTGLAHLFEHLMFKGTARHPTGEFDREMERRGAQTNAATWVDWTYYHEALAATPDNLALVVEYEVDRMTGLVLDEKTFRSELEVVKNERRMAVDNSASGRLGEALFRTAYTTHPYRWPTIGSMAHLEASTLDDLSRFYQRHYAPNNAVLVLAGALEPAPTLSLLARRYGGLAAQELAPAQLPAEPLQREARHTSFTMPLVAPQLAIAYRAPPQHHASHLALQMLNEILVTGDAGRLYNRLVTEEQLAVEVQGSVTPFADPGLYEIFITARPEADLRAIERVVQEELDAIGRGLSADEIDKARFGLELSTLEDLKDAEGVAEALGHYEATLGDFTGVFALPGRLTAMRSEDLVSAARASFAAHNRTSVAALPEVTDG